VTGRQFNDLHKFFKEQYAELNEYTWMQSPSAHALLLAWPSARQSSLLSEKNLVTCDEQYHDWRSMKRWPRCCERPWKGSHFKAAVLALEERPFL
jgi:hypothetical protein